MFWGKEMHKLKRTIWSLLLAAGLLAALAVPAGQPLAFAAEKEVYLGGMPAGFTLGMDGAQIVGFCEVLTKEGTRSPAKEAGLEAAEGSAITPHQLRHAFATILFDAGIDVKVAQELLGHSSIQVTRDIYTHIRKSRMESTAETLNKYLSGGACKNNVIEFA